MSDPVEQEQEGGNKKTTMCPDEYLPIDEEAWEKSGSKFAKAGAHVSVMGMPSWKDPGKSYQFPFAITDEQDPDNGLEGTLFTGMVKFSLDPIFKACGVTYSFENKKLKFDKMAFVGKKFLTVWTEQVDTRPIEKGGKGTKYTKPTMALPLGAKTEDLGIG